MGNTQVTHNLPEPGQLVMVRQRHFVVVNVQRSNLPPDTLQSGDQTLQHVVSLSSVEDDALGEELRVVWELEPGAHAYEKLALPQPTQFDDPVQMDAFLDAVRWGAISSADDRALQSPFRSCKRRLKSAAGGARKVLHLPGKGDWI